MQRFSLFSLVFLLLGACSSTPVETDYNRGASFNTYQRYHWQEATSGGDSTVSPFNIQRVRDQLKVLLDSQLYKEAPPDAKPDFLVRYFVSERLEGGESNTRGSIGLGTGTGMVGMGMSVGFPLGQSRPKRRLRITIDVIDGVTGQTSWRGSTVIDTDDASADIPKAVNAIWRKYPPK